MLDERFLLRIAVKSVHCRDSWRDVVFILRVDVLPHESSARDADPAWVLRTSLIKIVRRLVAALRRQEWRLTLAELMLLLLMQLLVLDRTV